MDALRKHDLETMQRTSPAEKARQAFELFDLGVRLKLAALRTRDPAASDEQIEKRLRAWLAADG